MEMAGFYIFLVGFSVCAYAFFGHVLWELHREAMKTNKLCWLFWPDIDVKFIGKKFLNKQVGRRFFLFIYYLWPFRLLQILIIFVARIAGLIIISFVTGILLVYDFFEKRGVMRVVNYPHNQDVKTS